MTSDGIVLSAGRPGIRANRAGPNFRDETLAMKNVTDSVFQLKWWIGFLALIGAAAGALISNLTPPQYSAVALLMAMPREAQILGDEPATSGLSSESVVLETQIQLINSPAHLLQVTDDIIKNRDAPSLLSRVGLIGDEAETGEGAEENIVSDLFNYLQRNLVVHRQGRAEMIAVGITSVDPGAAAELANVVAMHFLDVQVADKRDEIRRITDLLESRAEALEAELQRAESASLDQRKQMGLSSLDTPDPQRVAELDRALVQAEIELEMRQARLDHLQSLRTRGASLAGEPEIAGSDRIADTLSAAQPGETQGASAGDDPSETSAEIKNEIDRILGALRGERDSVAGQVEALRAARARSEAAVMEQAASEVLLSQLDREAEAIRKVLDRVRQRLVEVREQIYFAEPDARLVSPALPPNEPSTPGTALMGTMGAIVFGLLGILGAVAFGLSRSYRQPT